MDPNPKLETPSRPKLKQKLSDLRMEKRVGKYNSDPNNPSRGIFKAPADEQRTYKKGLREKIREVKNWK